MTAALVTADKLPGATRLVVVVPGRPISKNEYQRVANGHSYITPEGRDFQALIRKTVRAAAEGAGWVVDPFEVEHIAVSYRKFNTGADCLAGLELILDALQYQRMPQKRFEEREFWGLYANDRCVSISLCPRATRNGGADSFLELSFVLLAAYDPRMTIRNRESWKAQQKRRDNKRAARIAEQAEKRKAKRNGPPTAP